MISLLPSLCLKKDRLSSTALSYNRKLAVINMCVAILFCILPFVSSCKKTIRSTQKDSATNPSPQSSIYAKVRFRPQWLHQAQFAGFYVAYKKGFYRDLGIDVEIQPGGPEHPAAQSLKDGSTDITTMFLLSSLKEISTGTKLVNLAQISQKSALMLVGKKSRGINSVQSMKNKKIGLWHSDFRELSEIFIEKHNLKPTIIPIDYSLDLFLLDLIDVMNVMRYNEYHQLLQAGIEEQDLSVFEFSEWSMNIPEDGIYCSEEYFVANRKLCQDFVEASIDGWLYALNNQQEALDIVIGVMQEAKLPVNRPHQKWMLSQMKDIILQTNKRTGVLHRSDFDSASELIFGNNSTISYENFFPLGIK